MQKLYLAALAALAACSDGTAPRAELPGTWVLVSVDGQPVPVTGVHSGTIQIQEGGSYTAVTCYAIQASGGDCATSRTEVGSYSVSDGTLQLNAGGGYSRSLAIGSDRLIQQSGGDTGSAELVYAKQ